MSTFDQPKGYGAKKSSYPNDMARSHAELMLKVLVEWNESGVYGQVELLVGHWSTINSLIHTKAWHKTRRPNKPQRVKCNLPARSNLHAVACC